MKVISFYDSDNQAHWLEEIKRSDWRAGAFLHNLLSKGTFFDAVGQHSKVLLLTEGDELISFCTYAEKDDIQPTELTPWVGFVYTFPAHRGHRYAGLLFDEVERLARREQVREVYLSTNHIGLYEKYGFTYKTQMNDMDGEPSRVYVRKIGCERKILETKRLILRAWDEADAEECYRYAKDPRVGPAAGWPVHTSVENTRQVIRDILAVPETYAIVWKETGLPVGSIGLHFHSDLAEKDDEAELGYWLGVPWWGRGIVPEAAGEVLRHAFEDLNLQRVWCGYFDGNEKSRRVQEKLGFRYQWTTEDVPVPQMGETRRGIANLLTRAEWLEERETKKQKNAIAYRMIEPAEMEKLWELQRAYKAEIGENEPGKEDCVRLAAAMDKGQILFFGAWDGAVLAGCCSVTVGFSTFDYAPGGVFEDFYIRPAYRHRGIAPALVRFAYSESGVSSMTVGCADCDVEMYRALGFSVRLGNLLAFE